MYKRHGILANLVVMVLIFTMPLCCCIVKSASGSTGSCCSTAVQEVSTSCCKQIQKPCSQNMNQGEEEESESEPCNGDCRCTIKGTIYVQDWTPPVDLYGTDAPTPFFVNNTALAVEQVAITFANGPPKYDPHTLGFSSAPPIRGTLILEV